MEKTKEQQKKRIEELEEQLKQATPTTTAVVTLSPQQAMSSLAQFTQAMAQGNTTPGVGSTQGPPAQYFNIPQKPMGVLPGAAPSRQAVSMPAGTAQALGQVMTTPNQGYMNPSMTAPYYGSPQVPMILHPPTVLSPCLWVTRLKTRERLPSTYEMMNNNYLKHYPRKDSKNIDLNPVDTPVTREKTRKTLT